MNIKDNLSLIHQQIAQVCLKTNRNPDEIQLLAVSKTKSADLVKQAYLAGQRHFGENYVQEGVEKVAQLSDLSNICWHFIGPIQSNKTKLIAENFSWVHSVDRIKIAARLNDQRSSQDTPLNICLQVNISEELAKSGTNIESLPELAQYVSECQHLKLRGVMAIPQKNAPMQMFEKMNEIFCNLKKQYSTIDTLSMGMTNDMADAISAGSTMVRIGTAIFGKRG